MNPKMLEVQARVLPPPMVTYKDPRSNSLKNLLPEGGAWNLQNCKLYEPAQLNRWAIVVLEKQVTADSLPRPHAPNCARAHGTLLAMFVGVHICG